MLVRKRGRPEIKRTTSMTGIKVDLGDQEPSDHDHDHDLDIDIDLMNLKYTLSFVSPRSHGSNDNSSSHFLRSCCLCRRPLSPARDIYIYRGDTAFCSIKCREQQMKQDETNEKCSGMGGGGSMEGGNHASPSSSATSSGSRKS